uniref:Uncharacterized protein n=1 Tax=Anguilla anguilla TaxID=7936 RepID=A0A0E9U8L4_ANGAN
MLVFCSTCVFLCHHLLLTVQSLHTDHPFRGKTFQKSCSLYLT